MLNLFRRAVLLSAFLAFLVATSLLILSETPAFEKCTANGSNETNVQKAPEDVRDTFILNARLLFRCGAVATSEYNAVVTAFATIVIAGFTGTLWWATRAQLKHLAATLRLARREFLATHRPKMEIRFVRKLPDFPNHPPDEQSIRAEFEVVNKGESIAFVTGSSIKLGLFPIGEWPHPADLIGAHLIVGIDGRPRRFGIGATDRITVESDVHDGLIFAMNDQDRALYLIGWIVYEDVRGENIQTTYFCREFSRETERFTPAKDCDYETQ